MKVLMLSTDRKIFEPASAVRARMVKYAAVNELFIVVLGLKRAEERHGQLRFLGLPRWQVLFWRPEKKFDLITSQDSFETGFIAWRLAKRLQTKLELQIHTDIGSPYFWQESLKNKIRFLLIKFLLTKADNIRVVSQRIADFLEAKSWKLKATPIIRPIAVDTEKMKNALITVDLHKKCPQFSKIILMASRLTREKNIGLALETMREVVKNKPRIGLVIVGGGPELEKLKLKAKSYKLEASIVFEPWIDRETLFSYYKTCDVFLVTSLYEGYGMTLVEAHAAGCTIVSTDVGIAREILSAENIVIINDHQALAEKIILALN